MPFLDFTNPSLQDRTDIDNPWIQTLLLGGAAAAALLGFAALEGWIPNISFGSKPIQTQGISACGVTPAGACDAGSVHYPLGSDVKIAVSANSLVLTPATVQAFFAGQNPGSVNVWNINLTGYTYTYDFGTFNAPASTTVYFIITDTSGNLYQTNTLSISVS